MPPRMQIFNAQESLDRQRRYALSPNCLLREETYCQDLYRSWKIWKVMESGKWWNLGGSWKVMENHYQHWKINWQVQKSDLISAEIKITHCKTFCFYITFLCEIYTNLSAIWNEPIRFVQSQWSASESSHAKHWACVFVLFDLLLLYKSGLCQRNVSLKRPG